MRLQLKCQPTYTLPWTLHDKIKRAVPIHSVLLTNQHQQGTVSVIQVTSHILQNIHRKSCVEREGETYLSWVMAGHPWGDYGCGRAYGPGGRRRSWRMQSSSPQTSWTTRGPLGPDDSTSTRVTWRPARERDGESGRPSVLNTWRERFKCIDLKYML